MTEKEYNDIEEWNETRDMLTSDEEVVVSDLSFGQFVTLKKELFDRMIEEINDSRIQKSNLEGEVELIVISEAVNEKDNGGSDED